MKNVNDVKNDELDDEKKKKCRTNGNDEIMEI